MSKQKDTFAIRFTKSDGVMFDLKPRLSGIVKDGKHYEVRRILKNGTMICRER